MVFLTQDFVGLLIGMAILHFFWSASLPLVEALTLGHLAAAPERYGRIRLWGSVGFIVTVMGVGLLLDAAPISSQLWVSWVLLLGTLVSALTLTEVPARAGQAAGSILVVLRQRKVVFLLGAGLLMSAAHGALTSSIRSICGAGLRQDPGRVVRTWAWYEILSSCSCRAFPGWFRCARSWPALPWRCCAS